MVWPIIVLFSFLIKGIGFWIALFKIGKGNLFYTLCLSIACITSLSYSVAYAFPIEHRDQLMNLASTCSAGAIVCIVDYAMKKNPLKILTIKNVIPGSLIIAVGIILVITNFLPIDWKTMGDTKRIDSTTTYTAKKVTTVAKEQTRVANDLNADIKARQESRRIVQELPYLIIEQNQILRQDIHTLKLQNQKLILNQQKQDRKIDLFIQEQKRYKFKPNPYYPY